MIALTGYLVIGVVVLPLIVAFNKLTADDDSKSLSNRLRDIDPKREKLWYRILDDVIGPAMVGLLLVPFWPVMVVMMIHERIFSKPNPTTFDAPEFAVERTDLLEAMSVREVEQREKILDPLGAVPDLPFGHLNAAWEKFLEKMEPQDELWAFSAYWTLWGRKEQRLGYVIVRGDVVGQHFLTMRKEVEDPVPENELAPIRVGGKRKLRFKWLNRLRDTVD